MSVRVSGSANWSRTNFVPFATAEPYYSRQRFMKAQRSPRLRRDLPATASKSGEGRSASREVASPETPFTLEPIGPRSIAAMQRTLGNQSTSRTIAGRTEPPSAPASAAVPNVLQLIAETAPALLAVIPAPEMKRCNSGWQLHRRTRSLRRSRIASANNSRRDTTCPLRGSATPATRCARSNPA